MSPQPLSRVLSNASYDFAPHRIGERPELAALLAKVVAISATVEINWGRLLAGMLGANAPPVVAMYLALSGENAQRDALSAAAEKVLQPEHKELFDALTKIARPLAKARNKIVHWGWGICNELPDALLLQDPQSMIHYHRKRDEYIRDVVLQGNDMDEHLHPEYDPGSILVFRKSDFEQLSDAFNRLRRFLELFTNFVANPSLKRVLGDHTFQRLLTEPEIADALAQIRAKPRSE